MRRGFLWTVPLFVAMAVQVLAQQGHPSPFAGVLHRHKADPPAEPKVQVQSTVFDATRLGAPVKLDKDWRVGVTADPAAANPLLD